MSASLNHVPAGNYLQGYSDKQFVVSNKFDLKGVPCGAFEILVNPKEREIIVIENSLDEDSALFQAGMDYARKLLQTCKV